MIPIIHNILVFGWWNRNTLYLYLSILVLEKISTVLMKFSFSLPQCHLTVLRTLCQLSSVIIVHVFLTELFCVGILKSETINCFWSPNCSFPICAGVARRDFAHLRNQFWINFERNIIIIAPIKVVLWYRKIRICTSNARPDGRMSNAIKTWPFPWWHLEMKMKLFQKKIVSNVSNGFSDAIQNSIYCLVRRFFIHATLGFSR